MDCECCSHEKASKKFHFDEDIILDVCGPCHDEWLETMEKGKRDAAKHPKLNGKPIEQGAIYANSYEVRWVMGWDYNTEEIVYIKDPEAGRYIRQLKYSRCSFKEFEEWAVSE